MEVGTSFVSAHDQLLGMEPICCFCEVSSHHITISNEKDPEKMMYGLHLLQVSFRLCTVWHGDFNKNSSQDGEWHDNVACLPHICVQIQVSSRRLVICSMRPTEQVRKANAFTGTKTQFDEGRAVLVAKSRDEIGQWHDIMRWEREGWVYSSYVYSCFDIETFYPFQMTYSKGSSWQLSIHKCHRENARELLRKEDKCSRDDAEVLTFDLR